jgi:hypothetical protein
MPCYPFVEVSEVGFNGFIQGLGFFQPLPQVLGGRGEFLLQAIGRVFFSPHNFDPVQISPAGDFDGGLFLFDFFLGVRSPSRSKVIGQLVDAVDLK